jgi:UDP-GlcNAc3NAcA epimerase
VNKILTIVGARPQFVKAAVVSKALSKVNIQEEIIHTGQHYDYNMSTVFWKELNIPAPSVNLEIGSGQHGSQTGQMMEQIEKIILSAELKPQALLVYGDTNSTLAGALVASKLNIPILHIEAGLRSFNKEMPEEINRILTDHVSDLLFCSSDTGVKQLKKEGLTKGVHNCGDVMYDAVKIFSKIAEKKIDLSNITSLKSGSYSLATIHRPSNTDTPENIKSIVEAFSDIKQPIIWPVHPRNKTRIAQLTVPQNLILIDPVSYLEMLLLIKHSEKVLTDSGGLQKEAYWLQKQCITLRNETEWIETLNGDWNTLVGSNKIKILRAFNDSPKSNWVPLYGNGKASEKIASQILDFLSQV